MSIKYDCARSDITFCTMCFKMPNEADLSTIKHSNRRFKSFYLKSLLRLCQTFKRVALWCDAETAEYLTKHGWGDKIQMRIMDLTDLPHWSEREDSCKIMHDMKRHVGYFLHHREPETWRDYLPVIWAKPAIMDWAAQNNQYDSKYFMWIDAGAFSPKYINDVVWNNWTGVITARPTRVRMTIAPTLGKSRPRFVPRFMYDLYKWLFGREIMPATAQTLAKQNFTDIAMINADYDVPAGSFMIPLSLCHDFHVAFERTRKMLKRHNLVCVEQGVFQVMMKLDADNMFELKYIHGYDGLYAAIACGEPDHLL